MDIFINILLAVGVGAVLALVFGACASSCRAEKREEKKEDADLSATEACGLVAFVRCGGGNDSSYKYTYSGAQDCAAAELVAGGPKECRYACLGLGSCVSVCPRGAMEVRGGVAVVDEEKCDGCGKCVCACPREVIELVPRDADFKVRCRSVAPGSELRKICDAGCIGCMLCANTCKYDAIEVSDNIASINYEKCVRCGGCADVCPRGIITAPPKAEQPSAEEDEEEFDVLKFIEEEKAAEDSAE